MMGRIELTGTSECTRRGFVTGASMVAAAAAGISFGPMERAIAADGTVVGVPESWDKEADIVVVGSGTSLTAAVEAVRAGLQTIVVEKADATGGTTKYSGGKTYICCSSLAGDADSKDAALAYMRHCNVDNYVTDEIINAYIDYGAPMIDMLIETTGCQWSVADRTDIQSDWEGASSSARSLNVVDEDGTASGAYFTNGETDYIEANGGEIMLSTAAKRLVTRPMDDGRQEVLGLIAVDGEGNEVSIKARKGVVLGTGSFDWNRELCNQLLPFSTPYTFQIPTCTGDGLLMAQAAGAQMGMTTQGWGCPVDIYAIDSVEAEGAELPFWAADGAFYDTYCSGMRLNGYKFVVSRRGQRFFSEPGGYSSMDAWAGVEGQGEFEHRYLPYSFAILDAQAATDAGLDALEELPAWAIKGDTIEDLAEKAGIDARNLQNTVDRWNEDAGNGVDTEYGKEGITALGDGPYYAIMCTMFYNGTHGGIKVNEKAQVIHANGDIVPRLYACGNCAAVGAPGRVYPGAGGSIGAGKVFGYIAALDIEGLEDWA